MPEIISIQVGQCGNQIGSRFWDLALQEHTKTNTDGKYNESLATFFRNVNTKKGIRNIPVGKGTNAILGLKARSVLVDMEEGVLNQVRSSPLSNLFDDHQVVSSNSGSGNNWAVGYHVYGSEYQDRILEAVRQEAEFCDSLQSFFIISSLGGGTGSGLGSRITELLRDDYPEAYRFNNVVIPSINDDVVTSPYNSLFSLSKLIDASDCIFPIENQALIDIISSAQASVKPQTKQASSVMSSGVRAIGGLCGGAKKAHPFEQMNNIAANVLGNLTSSMRFAGRMNVDLGDIVTNLIPFPRLKVLMPCMTPISTVTEFNNPPRRVDQMFTDAFQKSSQLIKADPKSGIYLACALIARGDIEISDMRRNIDRLRQNLRFASWNEDAWKIGLCSVPPIGQKQSLLKVANNSCSSETIEAIIRRFLKLYKRKANLHHYTKYMSSTEVSDALDLVTDVADEYRNCH